MRLTHNGRTAEYSYKATDEMGRRVGDMLRDRYGRKGFRVTTEHGTDGTQMVALSNLKWKPVPLYVRQEVPAAIDGYLVGFRQGHLYGMVSSNQSEYWDKEKSSSMDILINVRENHSLT